MTAKICSLAVTAVSKRADILFKHVSVKESCHSHVLKNPIEKIRYFSILFLNEVCRFRKIYQENNVDLTYFFFLEIKFEVPCVYFLKNHSFYATVNIQEKRSD